MNKKQIASLTVKKLIKEGKLEYSKNCYLCCRIKNTIFHHPDYDQPAFVVELCRPCHAHIHYGNILFLEFPNILPITTKARPYNTGVRRELNFSRLETVEAKRISRYLQKLGLLNFCTEKN